MYIENRYLCVSLLFSHKNTHSVEFPVTLKKPVMRYMYTVGLPDNSIWTTRFVEKGNKIVKLHFSFGTKV